jgi:hypothetical protein
MPHHNMPYHTLPYHTTPCHNIRSDVVRPVCSMQRVSTTTRSSIESLAADKIQRASLRHYTRKHAAEIKSLATQAAAPKVSDTDDTPRPSEAVQVQVGSHGGSDADDASESHSADQGAEVGHVRIDGDDDAEVRAARGEAACGTHMAAAGHVGGTACNHMAAAGHVGGPACNHMAATGRVGGPACNQRLIAGCDAAQSSLSSCIDSARLSGGVVVAEQTVYYAEGAGGAGTEPVVAQTMHEAMHNANGAEVQSPAAGQTKGPVRMPATLCDADECSGSFAGAGNGEASAENELSLQMSWLHSNSCADESASATLTGESMSGGSSGGPSRVSANLRRMRLAVETNAKKDREKVLANRLRGARAAAAWYEQQQPPEPPGHEHSSFL